MTDPTAKQLVDRSERAFSGTERVNAEDLWRRLFNHILPNDSAFSNTGSFGLVGTTGQKTTNRIFDGTAGRANRDLASFIDATLTNSATQWGTLEFDDEELQKDPGPDGAPAWLKRSTTQMFDALSNSNFNTEKASAYSYVTALGNMAIMHESLDRSETGKFNGFHFKNIGITSLAWVENRIGVVDTVYRRMNISAKEAVERFGKKNLSDNIVRDFENNETILHLFIHAIFPREIEDIDLVGVVISEKNRPFGSIYIEDRTKNIVEVSGYYEFPMYIARFHTGPEESIGRGPGHVALPDSLSLNAAIELLLEAGEVAIWPPVITNDEQVVHNSDFGAKKFIFTDDPNLRPYNPGTNINLTQLELQRLQLAIEKAFFLDKITLPPRDQTGEMSAFEIAKRLEQMQSLGPPHGMLDRDFMNPLMLRSFKIMLRGGAFDPIPQIVKDSLVNIEKGVGIKIKYVNTLERSRKLEQLSNIRQWIAAGSELSAATGSPDPMDRMNKDKIMALFEEVLGVSNELVVKNGDLKKIRDARAEQQQEAAQTDQAAKAADAVSKLK